jgi:hypothetical protein
MKLVGHRTESVYRRYAIVDHAMLTDAAAKLEAWKATQSRHKAMVSERRSRRKKCRKA